VADDKKIIAHRSIGSELLIAVAGAVVGGVLTAWITSELRRSPKLSLKEELDAMIAAEKNQ